MADATPTPPPTPTPAPGPTPPAPAGFWAGIWAQYRGAITHTLAAIAAALVTALLAKLGIVVSPQVVTQIVEATPAAAVAGDEFAQTFGWHNDPDVIAANADPAKTMQFAQTPAGRAAMGDDDVYLWQAVRKVNNRGPPWYPNVDQKNVGCCVGCGWKHSCDVVQATQILAGHPAEWKPVSVEVIYGNSRVDVGHSRLSGDGSTGAWAKGAVEQDGLCAMEKVGTVDLSTFSPTRARQYGRSGVPKAVNAAAKSHPVKGCALVKSWGDVQRAVGQGYPVAVCSDRGFTMERDRDGFATPQGTWNHCMAILGVRGGSRPGGFILNSWGDQAHTGPTYPADMPVAGFWADATVIDRMVRQGDSFALADVAGFPARTIPDNWFIRHRHADLFALAW